MLQVQDTNSNSAVTIFDGNELYVSDGVLIRSTTTGEAVINSNGGTLENYGTILGNIGVVFLDIQNGGGTCNLYNGIGGNIRAFLNGTAMQISGPHHIENAGNIEVGGDFSKGIFTTGSGVITNYGDISAGTAIYQSDFLGLGAGLDPTVVKNFGVISGITASYDGTSSMTQESILNYGVLRGDVILGNGLGNVVDTRHGAILGSVIGGSNGDKLLGGTSDDDFNGGGGNDIIKGYGGDDIIAGGAGHDALTGGSGNDTFHFDSFAAGDSDTIGDFSHSVDTIELDHSIFTLLGQGSLSPSAFQAGTMQTATDHIFYNTTTGALYYDTNGSAAGGTHLVATLVNHPLLSASDFLIV